MAHCMINHCKDDATFAVGQFPYCKTHAKDVLWTHVQRARTVGDYPIVRPLTDWPMDIRGARAQREDKPKHG